MFPRCGSRFHVVAWFALVLAVGLASCGAPRAAEPPPSVQVGADPDPDDPAEASPARAQASEPFEDFLARFLEDLLSFAPPELESEAPPSGPSTSRMEAHVDPALGLFLLVNPGAFTIVEHHSSYSAIARSTHFGGALLAGELGCAQPGARGFAPGPAAIPKYSCEEEKYDTAELCTRGQLESDELRRHTDWMLEYELIDESAYEQLRARVAQVEPKVTHYIFSTVQHRGYYFGQVDGVWRLLWVRAVAPCSA